MRRTTTATAGSCSTCCETCWQEPHSPLALRFQSHRRGSALMPKVSADHLQARRRQILDGARSSFARHGYEGATVRVLEEEIGLSRGAIFHHFPDKDALFMALAVEDAEAMLDTVAEYGLVQVMREMIAAPDAGRLGTQLEIARRLRTDPGVPDRLGAKAVGTGTGRSGPAHPAAGRRHRSSRCRHRPAGKLSRTDPGGTRRAPGGRAARRSARRRARSRRGVGSGALIPASPAIRVTIVPAAGMRCTPRPCRRSRARPCWPPRISPPPPPARRRKRRHPGRPPGSGRDP